ncbi:sporulation protein [Chitinibacteraceae bacterium HSL-7]
MFKKLLAAVGVGGATVDTVLQNASLFPGETLHGEVRIQGGQVAQEIEYVDLVLMTEAEHESGEHESRVALPLGRFRAAGRTRVEAGQRLVLPFALALPMETPVNHAGMLATPGSNWPPQVRAAVWVHTDLAIASAVDASDRDFIEVKPLPQMQRLITAMAQLGFAHASSDVEVGTARVNGVQSTLGCYQEFEFKPAGSFGRSNEVEITCIARADGVHVLIEVDRRFRGDAYFAFLMGPNWASVRWEDELRRVLG